jgi:glutamate-1-semialdehyde 2,1-aminomutase
MTKRDRSRSEALYARAKEVIPGGVNSPVRAFRGVGGTPVFLARGEGARVYDADGNAYLDYVGSWGPFILGHAHPEVIEAIREAALSSTSFGAPTEREVRFAEELVRAVPSMDKVRLVSSGTEATMSALRLARGATGRNRLVKIDGAYHGHADCLLVAAGSGAATLGLPGSAGVPRAVAADTLTVAWNDEAALEAVFAAHEGKPTEERIAAVIVEPVCGNMGAVGPRPGYLERLRALTEKDGAILIFDEVMTGFRLAYGGAQARFHIRPDLTCLGKVVGGGMPLAAYGGRADLMAHIAPDGPVYQAGTLSGNPLAVAAGEKTIEILRRPGTYEKLEEQSRAIADGLVGLAAGRGIPLMVNRVGSMFTGFFTGEPVHDFAAAKRSDTARFGRFFHTLLEEGVYLPPSQFEAAFVSLAHDAQAVDQTHHAFGKALATL